MPRLSMHHVLDWRWVSFHSFVGWMVILANVGNAIAASVFLVLVVSEHLAFVSSVLSWIAVMQAPFPDCCFKGATISGTI